MLDLFCSSYLHLKLELFAIYFAHLILLTVGNFFRKYILAILFCFGILTYPYLKFDPFVLSEDGLDFEINTNSGNKGRSERVVGVAEKEAGLAHRTVANN